MKSKGAKVKIITTAVIKGGTGKTTTAAAIAQAAASNKKKVLAIDLDPQGNLTSFLGEDTSKGGSYRVLHGAEISEMIQSTEQGIDLIAASADLAAERTAPASANRLRDALEAVKDRYSLIVIDTPPTMGELVYNAFQASTGVIIPLETDINSLQGLYQIADIVKQMQKTNTELAIAGVVLTRYDPRPKINNYLQGVISDKCKEIGIPYIGEIRNGVAVREAQAFQQSLYEYAPKSKPALDYLHIYNRIVKSRKK